MQDDRLAQARLLVANYVEPYLGMPLGAAKAVKSVRFEAGRPLVEVELGFPLGAARVGGASDGNFTAAAGITTLDGLGPRGSGASATTCTSRT